MFCVLLPFSPNNQTTLQFESESNEIVNVIQNAIWQLTKVTFSKHCMFSLQDYPKPPPVGTRVRRGPHWKWGDQDGNRPGTIVKAGGTPGQCHYRYCSLQSQLNLALFYC